METLQWPLLLFIFYENELDWSTRELTHISNSSFTRFSQLHEKSEWQVQIHSFIQNNIKKTYFKHATCNWISQSFIWETIFDEHEKKTPTNQSTMLHLNVKQWFYHSVSSNNIIIISGFLQKTRSIFAANK